MELKNYFAQDAQGNVLPGATCHLYLVGTTSHATGLQDSSGDALGNPFTSGANGLVQFAAPNGDYDLRVVQGGRDYTVRVQCLDVSEQVAAASAAAGLAIDAVDLANEAADRSEAAAVYMPAGTGAISRTTQDKLRESISVLDFGAIGDGTLHTVQEWITGPLARYANLAAVQADYPHVTATTEAIDMVAIQAAINASIYGGLRRKVLIPAGVYYCNGPLHLGYGVSFSSCVLEGEGIRYAAESGFNGTAIVFTHNNAPGIVVQGGRFSVICNLTIKGANVAYITANGRGTAAGSAADLVASNWVDTGFPAASSSRYAPYAGVAVDPYSGVRPGVSYPDVAYPAYLGAVAQYGKNFSSAVTLENVGIAGFVAGLAVQPCDADGNGDYIKLKNVVISQCQYGVSICNTQSRLVHLTDCQLNQVHTGIVTTKHGRQSGKPAILAESCEFGATIKWIDLPNISYGGFPRFVSCYGELVYSIGNVGANSFGSSTVEFNSCEFAFQLQYHLGVPKYIFENDGNGFVAFNGCGFGLSPSNNYAFGGLSKSYLFNQCVTSAVGTSLYEKFSLNATLGITTSQLGTDFPSFSVYAKRYNLDTGADSSVQLVSKENIGARAYCLPAVTRTALASLGQDDPGAPVKMCPYTMGKGSLTFSTSGRDVTVGTGLAGNEWAIHQRGIGVGDTVWDDATGITFRVRSRTGGDIIMRAISGYDAAGNLLSPITTAGALYCLNSRIYTPTYPLYCNTTHANAVASNISRGDDTAAFIDTDLVVGDYVYYRPWGDRPGGENRIQIAARDGTARTLTVSGEFWRTATFRRLALFIRAEAPNA